jgi:sugar phosphate isomerase/epimerase
MRNWIDVSAELGSPAIRIFAGGAPKGVEDDQARKWVVESIESVCDHAARRGVFLAIENHGGVVADVEGLLAIVKAVKSDWVAVNLDTGNFRGPDAYGQIERAAAYSVTCQIKVKLTVDGKREEIDLPRLAGILRRANYRGYVTLEYEEAEDPMTAVPRWLEAIRKAM